MKPQSLFAQRMKQKKQVETENGFPAVFKVSEVSPVDKAQSLGIPVNEYKKIEEENMKTLASMSSEQIEALQQQIKDALSDDLIRMFQNGDIYKKRGMAQEINQNIELNSEQFRKFVDDDFVIISRLAELTQQPEIASVRIALQLGGEVLKAKNALQLEEIKLSEYLIELMKSTNLSISSEAFDLLYQYWSVLVPDCWNLLYNFYSGEQLAIYDGIEKALDNLYQVELEKKLDLIRLRNVLCRVRRTYGGSQKATKPIETLKLALLSEQFEALNTLPIDASDTFLIKRLYENFNRLTDTNCNLLLAAQLNDERLKSKIVQKYNERFLCSLPFKEFEKLKRVKLQELALYEILPFQQELLEDVDLDWLVMEVKFQAKTIISKKLRKICKWRVLDVVRTVYKHELKHVQKFQVMRNHLKVVLTEKEKEVYASSEMIESFWHFMRSEAGFDLYFANPGEMPMHAEYCFLKLLKLLQMQEVPNLDYFKVLLVHVDFEKLIPLLNKNVSYFERLLQKTTFDSYFNRTLVTVLFMFLGSRFNKDFHQLLFLEFSNQKIQASLDLETYKDHKELFAPTYAIYKDRIETEEFTFLRRFLDL